MREAMSRAVPISLSYSIMEAQSKGKKAADERLAIEHVLAAQPRTKLLYSEQDTAYLQAGHSLACCAGIRETLSSTGALRIELGKVHCEDDNTVRKEELSLSLEGT
jgi:hypothetical protein